MSNPGVIARGEAEAIYCITSAISPKIPQLTMLSHANSTLFIIAKVVALLPLLANLAHQKMTVFLGRRRNKATA